MYHNFMEDIDAFFSEGIADRLTVEWCHNDKYSYDITNARKSLRWRTILRKTDRFRAIEIIRDLKKMKIY